MVRRRPRRAANANPSSFDESESESEPSEDDDGDVYNSEEDEPDESDLESDFAPSPKQPARKAPPKAKPRGPVTTKMKRPPAPPARKPLGNVKNTPKPRPVSAEKRTSVGAGSAKKRLGARIPSTLTGLSKSTSATAQRPRPVTPAKGASAVYRSGLSRNAAIPRLHSYLGKS